MDFNSDDFDAVSLTFGFSDDRGNVTQTPLVLTGIAAYPGFLNHSPVIN